MASGRTASPPRVVDPSAQVDDLAQTETVRPHGSRVILQRLWEPPRLIPIPEGVGSHGGGDRMLLDDVFRGPGDDPLRRQAGYLDGVRSVIVGVAGNESIRTGMPVRVADLGLPLIESDGGAQALRFRGLGVTGRRHLILVLGQSNANGSNTDYEPDGVDARDPRIEVFPGSGPDAGTIVHAREPLPPIGGHPPGGLGPGGPFAALLLPTLPPEDRILLVPITMGSTGMRSHGGYAGVWKVDLVKDGAPNLFDASIKHSTAALEAAGPGATIDAILWHQGETDGGRSEADYAADLDELIGALRERLPAAADAPFLVGQLPAERRRAYPNHQGVADALRNTPNRVPNTGYAEAPPFGHVNDLTHAPDGIRSAHPRRELLRRVRGAARALSRRRATLPIEEPRRCQTLADEGGDGIRTLLGQVRVVGLAIREARPLSRLEPEEQPFALLRPEILHQSAGEPGRDRSARHPPQRRARRTRSGYPPCVERRRPPTKCRRTMGVSRTGTPPRVRAPMR